LLRRTSWSWLPGACDPLSSKGPESPAPSDLQSGVYNFIFNYIRFIFSSAVYLQFKFIFLLCLRFSFSSYCASMYLGVYLDWADFLAWMVLFDTGVHSACSLNKLLLWHVFCRLLFVFLKKIFCSSYRKYLHIPVLNCCCAKRGLEVNWSLYLMLKTP